MAAIYEGRFDVWIGHRAEDESLTVRLASRYTAPVIGEIDLDIARDFGTALLLGALLGTEREKRNAREGGGIAGLRSFVMLAQVGAIGGFLTKELGSPWILAAALFVVGGIVVAGYLAAARTKPESLGLTTEFAAVVACLLGALTTLGHREFAIGLGVTTAALLAYKQPLHAMVGRIQWEDVLVGMRLLLATFIVLPLLPDRAIDPWGALNPYTLWLLVLLISSMSLVGYVATRWLGSGHGTAVAAACGGLVSSTVVTLTFVKQSRERPDDARRLAGGILLSWSIMYARVVVTAWLVYPPLLAPMVVPFLAMGTAAALAGWFYLRGDRAPVPAAEATVALKNPFSLLAASKFALLFAVVQLLLKAAQHYLPGQGTYLIAGLAGLTELDAVTLSMAQHARGGNEAAVVAVLAIALATATNTLVKAGFGLALGDRVLRVPLVCGSLAIFAVGAVTLFLV